MSKNDKDPKEEIEKANKLLNTGIVGGITKGFAGAVLGKDFGNMMNDQLKMAGQGVDTKKAMDEYEAKKAQIIQTGQPGTAEVITVTDSGDMTNPFITIKLKVSKQDGGEYETDMQYMVTKLGAPRVGDKVNIKYNPANQSEIAIVQ